MVDVADNEYTPWQQTWVDYLDKHESHVDQCIRQLQDISGMPWDHKNWRMRWLWDYALQRRAEITLAKAG